MLIWVYLLNLIFIIPVALCNKSIPCDKSDEACLTTTNKAIASNPIKKLINSDPFHLDKIQAFVRPMNITLTDTYIYGLSACEGRELKLTPGKWDLTIFCPIIILQSNYEINGDVDSVHTEGKGKFEIFFEKYFIGLNGGYEAYADKNGEEHFKVTYYKMNFTEIQGKVFYNLTVLSDEHNEKSPKINEYVLKNWMKLHKIIGTPITYIVFDYIAYNVNKYLAIVPNLEIFKEPLSIKNLTIWPTTKN